MIEDDAKTLWCGNLSDQVTEELLYELFLQAGPLEKVRIARERDGRQKNFAFITFCHEVSVPYAISLFQGTSLFNRTLVLQCRNQSSALPPPIRCSSDQSTEFALEAMGISEQFSEMSDNCSRHHSFPPMNGEQHTHSNTSHRGKWVHRQQPYRPDDRDRGYGGHQRGHDNYNRGDRGRANYNQPWEGQKDSRSRHDRNYGRNNKRKR